MATDAGLGWTIIGQAETMQTDDAGAFVPGVTITFQLQGGQTGSVFVPNARYNVENVRAAVNARAGAMAAVAKLQG
jgi:hypothetical protein